MNVTAVYLTECKSGHARIPLDQDIDNVSLPQGRLVPEGIPSDGTDLVSPANCCPASPWSQSFGEWRGRLLDWHSLVGLPAVAPPRRQRSRLSAILQGGRLLPCSTYPFYLDVFGIRHYESPSRTSFPSWLHSHRPPLHHSFFSGAAPPRSYLCTSTSQRA